MKDNESILQQIATKKGQIAVLIDPEKAQDSHYLDELIERSNFAKIDYFFIGGSTVSRSEFEFTTNYIFNKTEIPVVIFPGSGRQVSNNADALLYISLLSGRNPEFLIGQHVDSALEVFKLPIEIIPTGYILIDGGNQSSVAYVSQTTPIPRNQHSIALKTAIAGHLMGKKLLFFDAGSGAKTAVPIELIHEVQEKLAIPIIVGGGVKSVEEIESFKNAGVNVIVIGNKIEEDIDFLLDIQGYQMRL